MVGAANALDAGVAGITGVTEGLVVTVCCVSGFAVTTVEAPADGFELPAGIVVVVRVV